MKIIDPEPFWAKFSRQKPFSKFNDLNDNKILKLRYKIKANLIKENLSMARKIKTKKKTEDNAKGLFILAPDKSLLNGLELIKNIKSNESWHVNNIRIYF